MNKASEIVSKCSDCGGITFEGKCPTCERARALEASGVDVLQRCQYCGIDRKKRVLKSEQIDTPFHYTCEVCQDAEKEAEAARAKRGEAARIEKDNAKREYYLSQNIPPLFSDATIDHIRPDLRKTIIENSSALFYGDFGTGKTFAAYALARYLFGAGKEIRSFRVLRAAKMMMELKAGFKNDTFEMVIDDLNNTGLLVIDEFGKNTGSAFEESVLFEIVANRFEYNRRTILIVNASNKEELLARVRLDVLDRFRRGLILFDGKSRR